MSTTIVAVHNHFNARKLCNVALSDDQMNSLNTPPPLKDNLVTRADGTQVNLPKPEDHVVMVGDLRLFMATVSGRRLVVTNTPNAALVRAV